MSENKLFLTISTLVHEIPEKPEEHKRDIQALFEENLETFLGIRLIYSKYRASDIDGHIDTLGLDAQNNPTIIVFGRRQNISRGLSHRQWLEQNRRAFEHEVSRQENVKGRIVWSNPRVICVASDFSNDEIQAVNQINNQNKNFELVRYKRYSNELLWLQFLNEPSGSGSKDIPPQPEPPIPDPGPPEPPEPPPPIDALYRELVRYIQSLGTDITHKKQKVTENFLRGKIKFVSLELFKKHIYVGMNLDLNQDGVSLEEGFTRDMTRTGRHGFGRLRVTIRSRSDIERAKPLIKKAYDKAYRS